MMIGREIPRLFTKKDLLERSSKERRLFPTFFSSSGNLSCQAFSPGKVIFRDSSNSSYFIHSFDHPRFSSSLLSQAIQGIKASRDPFSCSPFSSFSFEAPCQSRGVHTPAQRPGVLFRVRCKNTSNLFEKHKNLNLNSFYLPSLLSYLSSSLSSHGLSFLSKHYRGVCTLHSGVVGEATLKSRTPRLLQTSSRLSQVGEICPFSSLSEGKKMATDKNTTKDGFDYDLAVIGGGSGGLACAKMAAACGAKTVVFDFVKPSTQGTVWGLGGTCVNVGCVPKYLFHHTALLGQALHWDAPHMGWIDEQEGREQEAKKEDEEKKQGERNNGNEDDGKKSSIRKEVKWETCVQAVQNYIKSLNFSYRTGLRKAGVTYVNGLVKFKSAQELQYTLRSGEEKVCRAKHVVIAVGGRPHIPSEVEGALDFAITSDDIFSLKRTPKKTLCVGASYISLECAGFLAELGFDVTVAVRSILLRGFDRQCAEHVGLCLEESGVKLLRETLPVKMEKNPQTGRILVTLKQRCPSKQSQEDRKLQGQMSAGGEKEKVIQEEFDTVLYATGRKADTSGLNLEAAGVKTRDSSGKIICDPDGMTSNSHVYAIGDTVENFPELTPVAIKAGEILARRLFARSSERMDFTNIPTTVFTPIEYAHTGLSEETAEAKYGKEDLEIYLFQFSPLFYSCVHRQKAASSRKSAEDVDLTPPCLVKMICVKSEEERVVGLHFIGPSAGEIMQGFALSIRLGAKKRDFDKCVGIHPTNAEALMSLSITKRSEENFVATGGCGGGKCG